MFTRLAALAAIGIGGVLLSGCATMNEDQCRAGDWGGQGFADGTQGYPMSRLDDHAKACAKFQVTPNLAAYSSARSDGLRQYCTRDRGFQEGREGDSYHGVCPASVEAEFLPAYNDGREVYAAVSAEESARSNVGSYASRLEDLDKKIDGKQDELRAEGLTDEQRDAIRNRIRELRAEKNQTERSWRDAQIELEIAERNARDVRWHFERIYGRW